MSAFAEFALHVVAGIPVITAPAVIDIANADDLRVALLSATALGYATVVVDLSGTDLCDSAAMRELERGHSRAEGEGGELRLVVPPGGRLPRLFDIRGLNRIMQLYPTMTAALADVPAIAIQSAGPERPAGIPEQPTNRRPEPAA
jgi:anti-anti-sigma factor